MEFQAVDKIPWKECDDGRRDQGERSDCSWTAAEYINFADSYFGGPYFKFRDQLNLPRLELLNAALKEEKSIANPGRFDLWECLINEWAGLCFGFEADGTYKSWPWESRSPSPNATFDELVRQIEVDVHRSYNYIDTHLSLSEEKRTASQEILKATLEQLFDLDHNSAPTNLLKLEYLQGAHEICAVIIDVWNASPNSEKCAVASSVAVEKVKEAESREASDGSDDSEQQTRVATCTLQQLSPKALPEGCVDDRLLRTIAEFFITRLSCLHTNLGLDVGLYMMNAMILELTRVALPEVFKALCLSKFSIFQANWHGDGSELHFCIPWLATLFAHTIKCSETLIKIWDILLCFPPPFLIYFCSAVIKHLHDLGELNGLQDNRNKLQINHMSLTKRILPAACALLESYPYDCLFVGVWDDLSRVRVVGEVSTTACAGGGSLVTDYFDAQDSPYILIDEMSVLPPLYAPVLELERRILGGVAKPTGESPRSRAHSDSAFVRKVPKRIVAKRVSARVIRVAGLDSWAGKVSAISREWRWLTVA